MKLDLTSLMEELKRSFPDYTEQEIKQAIRKALLGLARDCEMKPRREKVSNDPNAKDAG